MIPEPHLPSGSLDTVIKFYKQQIDRQLLRGNLRLTAEERIRKLQQKCEAFEDLCKAGRWSKEYISASYSVPYVPAGLTPEEFKLPRFGC